jgi:hypothetical protein
LRIASIMSHFTHDTSKEFKAMFSPAKVFTFP